MNAPKRESGYWFKFEPAAFLADINVVPMSGQEVGIYWLLANYSWREGSLPDDLERLADLARVPYDDFIAAWKGKVGRCFTLNNEGRWVSQWVEEKRAETDERIATKQKAADTRWKRERAKKGKSKPTKRDPQRANVL